MSTKKVVRISLNRMSAVTEPDQKIVCSEECSSCDISWVFPVMGFVFISDFSKLYLKFEVEFFTPALFNLQTILKQHSNKTQTQLCASVLSVRWASVNFESCLPFFFISGISLWKVKEVFTEYGNPSCKIDANLLKIHRWPGFNMAKCGCKWEEEKSTLSSQINLSCSLQLINTTAYQKSCFIANDGNYCI